MTLADAVRHLLAGEWAHRDPDRILSEVGVGRAELIEASAIIASAALRDVPTATDADFERTARAVANGLVVGLRARQQMRVASPVGRASKSEAR